MKSKRNTRTGFVPVRIFSWAGGGVAAIALAAAPLPLLTPPAAAQSQTQVRGGQGVSDFYAARGGRPLWLAPGRSGAEAEQLIALLDSSAVDGLNPRRYKTRDIARALRSARSGDRRAVQRADTMLSNALVAYARDLRRAGDIGIIYVDPELRPGPPSPRSVLEAAAAAPSLGAYVSSMGWMHPIYGQLRTAITNSAYGSDGERQQLVVNLERARELPARGRHVLVNAAAQRLTMYEDDRVVDSMRVVVGKPEHATPMMAALIRYTALNPYWYVPPDLAAERIAPNVQKLGLSYLKQKGYQLLSDWGSSPTVLDPATVDWDSVAAGQTEVRLRQLPGPGNAMGRMKFMFPNDQGIYLHDTPDKELLTEASRLFSGGCVRLQDAARLATWLYGEPLNFKGAKSEQKVPLPHRVPVFITYLTAVPSGSSVAWFDDIYGRDAARLAQLRSGSRLAARR